MKYPKELEVHVNEIKEIVSRWPVEKSLDEVMAWVLQFEKADYEIALRILKNLNVIGPDDLNAALQIAYSKLLRHAQQRGEIIDQENTVYMAIGRDGKSGAMIAYNFRMINGLSSAHFFSEDSIGNIKEGKIKNLVLVDDIIATGDQSGKQLKELSEKALRLNIKNIYLVSAFGFKQGIEKLSSNTQVADVFSAVEYDECDTVMSLDSLFYDDLLHEKRTSYRDRISNIYKGTGYSNGIGALIAFYYNTPNCTIGAIWKNDFGWIPLFPRMFDAKAEGPELYKLDELLREEDGLKVIKTDCSIYVEGKVMELFLQEIAKLKDNFGYENMSIVSIGPFYSRSLIDSLKKYSKKNMFVTDEPTDSSSPHSAAMKQAIEEDDLVRIDQVMSYFDIEKIKSSEKFSHIIDRSIFDEQTSIDTRNEILAKILFNRNYRNENMLELIKCIDENKINELVNKFKK